MIFTIGISIETTSMDLSIDILQLYINCNIRIMLDVLDRFVLVMCRNSSLNFNTLY